jgi:hypothetical protein
MVHVDYRLRYRLRLMHGSDLLVQVYSGISHSDSVTVVPSFYFYFRVAGSPNVSQKSGPPKKNFSSTNTQDKRNLQLIILMMEVTKTLQREGWSGPINSRLKEKDKILNKR